MKHIAKYKLFESTYIPREKMLEYLGVVDDILLEINDIGFKTKTYLSKFYEEPFDECESIDIDIIKDCFTFEDVNDCIYRLRDYAKLINFNLIIVHPESTEEILTIEEFLRMYPYEEFYRLFLILYNSK